MNVAALEVPRGEVETIPPRPINEALHDTLEMLASKNLPILEGNNVDRVTGLIHGSDLVIIEAETGSGKSTATPVLALKELEARKPGGRIVVTQPRRVAVESLHRYLEPTMGDRVGFRHGRNSSSAKDPQLEFTIDQSLLNDMVRGDNPDHLLMKYDGVILDEIHERNANMDILMALLKQTQQERANMGKPLKIILTSATIDRERLIEYFQGANHIEIEGRMFPVTEHFEAQKVDGEDVMRKAAEKASEIHSLGDKEPGDMLIFMPGKAEIEATIDALTKQKNLSEDGVEFVPLIGGDEGDDNVRKIYEPSSKRRIFVATNVAETSITIPSVRVVIDSGLMRINVFNKDTGISGLDTLNHTKSNAKQRKGRAGRVAPGTAHYLFTKEELESRDEYLPAEILRTDLVSQVLLMKEMGIQDIPNFDFLDHPGKDKINQAISTLNKLGALNPDGGLSELGKQMTRVNAEPRFARMIVEAEKLGCLEAVSLIAGMLQSPQRNVFDRTFQPDVPFQRKYSRFIVPGSDILTRLNIWNEYVQNNTSPEQRKRWGKENGINTFTLFSAANARKDILKRSIKNQQIDISPENAAKITQSIAMGLIDNVVIRKNGGYQTLGGTSGIRIDRYNSVLAGTEPSAFISGNIRRTLKGDIFAGFNFTVDVEGLIEKAPYLENVLHGEKITAKEAEKVVESVATAVSQTEVEQETTAAVVQSPSSSAPEVPAEIKKETRLKKIQNRIRSWLKKLRIIK